ncbi:MAG: hypothetical protein JOY80_07695 [Candidatus Dormibacteraeota bacterium]|nr:hypothetical protein [Candidatus Dormibacteraeota bacterium]
MPYAAVVLLTTSAPAQHTSHTAPFTEYVYLALIAALVAWVVVYLMYKLVMTGRRDFGLPVRRRVFCIRLRVHGDQRADVPFWWTDLQVQRAVRSYWRRSLRSPFSSAENAPVS